MLPTDSALPPASHHVFTYGSLMFAPVWQQVVAGQYSSEIAILDGYARFAMLEETYPGMVACPGHQVSGVVYHDVSADDLILLDQFEGSAYRRTQVRVQTASGRMLTAQAYVFVAPQGLAEHPWDPADFALQRFLATYCRDIAQ